MPAPDEVRRRLVTDATAALEAMVDAAWDAATQSAMDTVAVKMRQLLGGIGTGAATVNPFRQKQSELPIIDPAEAPPMSPQRRGAQNRAPKGSIKSAIRDLIFSATPPGISREQIRMRAKETKGIEIKEGSMKQGLRLLRRANEIERKGNQWFPTKNGGQLG